MKQKENANSDCPQRPVSPTVDELETNLDQAIAARLAFEYRHGLEDGLAVAQKIRGWLTRQPDRAWQKTTREWADREIEKVMRELAEPKE